MSGTQVPVFSVPNYQPDNGLAFVAIMGGPSRDQISAWLREAREGKGVTQRQVSDAVGVTEKSVGRWERIGDTPLPPADLFLAMVKLYRAEKKLLVLLGSWEKFRKAAAGVAGRTSKAAEG